LQISHTNIRFGLTQLNFKQMKHFMRSVIMYSASEREKRLTSDFEYAIIWKRNSENFDFFFSKTYM